MSEEKQRCADCPMAKEDAEKIEPCPYCGYEQAELFEGQTGWWIRCTRQICGRYGAIKGSEQLAIAAWNAQAAAHKAKAKPPDIEPCPYCGGEARLGQLCGNTHVFCRQCIAGGPDGKPADAIRVWNKVAGLAAELGTLQAKLEEREQQRHCHYVRAHVLRDAANSVRETLRIALEAK